MVRTFPTANAPAVVALLVLGVLIPIAVWNQWQVRRGRYTNFDVSHRPHRATMYPLIVALLAVATAALYITHQPARLSAGMAAGCSLAACCWLANRWMKVSLHAAYSFFYALLTPNIGPDLLVPALLLATAIAWSRYRLGRHSASELLVGAALGLIHAAAL
jgi:membrane-associated phospholipid phosphatase